MGESAMIGMMIGAGAGQAYSQYQSGSYNSKISAYNAKIADMQAKDALRRGEEAANKHGRAVERLKGEQRAGFAGQGVDVSRGSAADVVDATQMLGDLDVAQIRNNAALEAWGFKVAAADARARSRIAKAEGTNAAIGTLLTTGAHAGYAYSRMPTQVPDAGTRGASTYGGGSMPGPAAPSTGGGAYRFTWGRR